MSKKIEPTINESAPKEYSKKFAKRSLIVSIVAAILVVAGAGSGIYYYIQYQNAKNVLGSSSKGASDVSELVKKVGKLIELPSGENPTIATVSDVKKLKGQAFFAHAKNGDKVLIYQKAKKAILYSPSMDKIIEVQAINISDANSNASSSATLSPTPSVPVKVVLLNGTKTAGLATTTEKNLTANVKNLTVVSKGNAKADSANTLIVDLTGKNSTVAGQIAATLKGQVGKLPVGEVKPANADIMIILGKQP